MVDWVRLGADLEDLATQALSCGKRMTGLQRPMVIQPYRGFVAHDVAHVRARVLEKPVYDNAAEELRIDATLAANLLRWVVLDMADVDVSVTVAGQTVQATSDGDGFVVAKVPVQGLQPGWHPVELAAERDGKRAEARGRVVRPDPASQIAVISDIDDTVLRTGMTEGLQAVKSTLLRDAHGRRPVPGTPSLYRGLARGLGRRPESTFFYVSSGPWNLYDMLVQFLALRGFPRGPLFMTDWRPGPKDVGQAVSGRNKENPGHKRARIRRILDSYPELDFVLLGDDGERDPEIYEEFLASDRDRIRAAFVRQVRSSDRAPASTSQPPAAPTASSVAPAGLLRVPHTTRLAELARDLGLVDDLTVEEVRTEIDARF